MKLIADRKDGWYIFLTRVLLSFWFTFLPYSYNSPNAHFTATATVAEDWTVHIDESTGNEYRHNSVTGEAAWCGEEVEAEYVHAVGDNTEGGKGAADTNM